MKKIPLTQGLFAIVNNKDYGYLSKYKWCTIRIPKPYAATNINKKTILMHRLIMKAPKGIEVDHKNIDTLDNREKNLRLATHSENQRNKGLQKNNKSGFKGVSYKRQTGRWNSEIIVNYKTVHLGYFVTAIEAAKVYNKNVKKYHGEFARLNNI